jgi:hypothetical protein
VVAAVTEAANGSPAAGTYGADFNHPPASKADGFAASACRADTSRVLHGGFLRYCPCGSRDYQRTLRYPWTLGLACENGELPSHSKLRGANG